MSASRGKVVVAMSGGVDSSVAACMLVEQGYEIVGLFMRHGAKTEEPASCSAESPAPKHQGCCSASDASDARHVAGQLGIPFYALNFEHDFDKLIDRFATEYALGRTPNPCIVCNDELKFGRIVEYADTIGAEFIATGHYAQIKQVDGQSVLCRGVDASKDQSYVLFGLEQTLLNRLLFPVGGFTKKEIRAKADKLDLPNRNKPDSVEICFVPDRNYARIVHARKPESFKGGEIVGQADEVLGHHAGIAHFTIGQRRGLGVATGEPVYVTQINVEKNTIKVGSAKDLMHYELQADRVNYLVTPPTEPFHATVQIRYLHRAAKAMVTPLPGGSVRVVFEKPQRAITPGQAAVFYRNDVVIGGGWIERSMSAPQTTVEHSDAIHDSTPILKT